MVGALFGIDVTDESLYADKQVRPGMRRQKDRFVLGFSGGTLPSFIPAITPGISRKEVLYVC